MTNYKQYLQSNHWREFRRKIYSLRKTCQNCSAKNKKLNIHHKNYDCLWKEKNSDVIVLCQDCHYRFHKKPKWKKKMKNKENLDFTKSNNTANAIYNCSDEVRDCKRCGESHSIFYKKYKNGDLRLCMACENSKPRVMAIKYEPDLDIPIL